MFVALCASSALKRFLISQPYVNCREHASKIKLPANVQDMKELAEVLREYKKAYLFHVSLIYSLVFILYVPFILRFLFKISADEFAK